MGWFDRLLGNDAAETDTSVKGWDSGDAEARARTTRGFLERVASAAGVANAIVDPKPQDETSDLRGTLQGFPLRLTLSHSGSVDNLTLRYASTFGFIDLEMDPDMPAVATVPVVEPWDKASEQVVVAPQIFFEGSDAKKEAGAFKALPQSLQTRVLDEMQRLRIRYFRSRPSEHDVTLLDSARDRPEPERWLADVLVLSADVARARGAKPPGAPAKSSDDDSDDESDDEESDLHAAKQLAAKLAAKIPHAKVVERSDRNCIDVCWLETTTPVRIVLDYNFDDVEAMAYAAGAVGTFDLEHDFEVTLDEPKQSGDVWDDLEHAVYFSKSVYVSSREIGARRQATLLRSIGSPLLDEFIGLLEEVGHHASLEDGVLNCSVGEFADAGDGELALQMARMLARVAAALPRREPTSTSTAVRCAGCHALWFPTFARPECCHCGVRP